VKRSVADWHRAFPDTVNDVGDVLAEGDLLAESWDHFDALGLLGQLGFTFRPDGPRRRGGLGPDGREHAHLKER